MVTLHKLWGMFNILMVSTAIIVMLSPNGGAKIKDGLKRSPKWLQKLFWGYVSVFAVWLICVTTIIFLWSWYQEW